MTSSKVLWQQLVESICTKIEYAYSIRRFEAAVVFFCFGLFISEATAQSIEVTNDDDAVVTSEPDSISINTIGDHAIRLLTGANQSLAHAGMIVVDANSTHGVLSTGLFADITILETGTIEVLNGSHAINAEGDNATVVNDGDITTSADSSAAIHSSGESSSIVNNGTLMATGNPGVDTAFGIRATGNGVSITNTGLIHTTGSDADGIQVTDGNNQTIVNQGIIMAEGGGLASGISAFGIGGSIVNTGEIQGSYQGVDSAGDGSSFENHGLIVGSRTGVQFGGENSTGINTGTIAGESRYGVSLGGATFSNSGQITGGQDGLVANALPGGTGDHVYNSGFIAGGFAGVRLASFDAVVMNSGTITGGFVGLYHGGLGAEIKNSGTITGDLAAVFMGGYHFDLVNSGRIASPAELDNSPESYALYVVGFGANVTLLPGSILEGEIVFGRGAEGTDPEEGKAYTYNSLTLAKGFNTALTFSETDAVGMPEIIADAPYAVTDDQVAHVGATGFGATDEAFNDLTGAVADALDERMAANRGTGAPSFAYERFGSEAGGTGGWFQVIGGYRNQQAGSSTLAFDNYLAGIVGGVDRDMDGGKLAGLFGGYAYNQINLENDVVTTSTNSVYGGGYFSRTEDAYFINLAATVGASFNDNEREIANNMVVGGLETADASYNGWFVSPALTLGSRHAAGGGEINPSVRLRYSALFLDSYTENGSAANMSVDSRTAQVGEVRGQLAWRQDKATESGTFHSALRAGVDGIFNWGDDVDATLYGQSLVFVDTDEASIARGFVGSDFAYLPAAGSSAVTFGFEVGYDTTDAFTAEARLGASRQF